MYRRPKANETEDDLLQMQKEFLENKTKNKIKPAAKLVPVDENRTDLNEQTEDKLQKENKTELHDYLANTFEAVPTNFQIGEVKENSVEGAKPLCKSQRPERGFPQAKRREIKMGTSLFSRQTKRLKSSDENVVNLPTESYMINSKEKDDIHKKNIDLLSKMSQEDILKERDQLVSMMDPALVAFVRSRRENIQVGTKHKTPNIEEQNSIAQSFKIEDIETIDDLLSEPQAKMWLNFDVIEMNKLCWMRQIDIPKINKNEQYEARFDFDGWLLPFSMSEIDEKSRILYHHGEEPGRPGYTLQELFQLARSSVMQQKVIALNTLSNVIKLHSIGIYDGIIDLPVEQCFFVLRFCLDDNTPGILNAAIKAMRNLFCSTIDETCLDSLLAFGIGMKQPILSVDDSNEDDFTVNDQQLAETNMVKCLMRTNIITRVRYIINVIKPSKETVIYCLEILLRLVRDSNFIMMRVYNCENLVGSIIKYFVPNTCNMNKDNNSSTYGVPLSQAVKFLRILISRSRHIANDLICKYNIMDSLLYYLSNDIFARDSNGVRLQTECFNLWCAFIYYGLTVDHFSTFTPLLSSMLEFHVNQTNVTSSLVKQGHAAALLNLIAQVGQKEQNILSQGYQRQLQVLFEKLCSQLSSVTEFSCGKFQFISSACMCLSNIVMECDQFNSTALSLLNSSGFSLVTTNIKNGSNYLNDCKVHQMTANFKTLEAAAWDTADHVIPLLQTNSCLPFMSAFSEFIFKCASREVKLKFIQHENINKYVSTLAKQKKIHLTSNWFSRIENRFIVNILKTAIAVQEAVDTAVYYELAVKCLSVFSNEHKDDVKYLLKEIIFNRKFYPSEVLLRNLSVSDSVLNALIAFDNSSDILNVYSNVLNLHSVICSTNLSIDIKMGNAIPFDWIYTPIMVLYSNYQAKKQVTDQEQTYLVENCLRWIFIYEIHFPKLAALIKPSDHYCRLACIFLLSDNLFLNSNIQVLTELCFRNLITKHVNEINFDKPIQGLDSFQNFYTQLLEQYQGVSYGNELFGNFILVPLAQKHNDKWRKSLWSEYAGILQIFNVTRQSCICPLDMFLIPAETDLSLLNCYKRALVSGCVKQHSVLNIIAKHHVENVMNEKT